MAWFWTDDLARSLVVSGQLDADAALRMTSAPVAIRVDVPGEDQPDSEDEDDLASAA